MRLESKVSRGAKIPNHRLKGVYILHVLKNTGELIEEVALLRVGEEFGGHGKGIEVSISGEINKQGCC